MAYGWWKTSTARAQIGDNPVMRTRGSAPRVDSVRPARAGTGAALGAIEVSRSSPTPAQLRALSATDGPAADLVRSAQSAFGDLAARGGRVLVTTSAGNGGKPVAVVLPAGFDPSRPARVQTHYHGDRTSSAEPDGYTTQAILELGRADPQQVFVLPEARAKVGASPTDWTNVQSQARTTDDALAAAGVTRVSERTVSAHSSGGRALARALGSEGGLSADRVVLLDCLYEPAATSIRTGLTALGDKVREIVVVRASNEDARANSMVAAFPNRARKLTIGATRGESAHLSAARFLLDGRQTLLGGGDTFAHR